MEYILETMIAAQKPRDIQWFFFCSGTRALNFGCKDDSVTKAVLQNGESYI